jgi:hypothetical protein
VNDLYISLWFKYESDSFKKQEQGTQSGGNQSFIFRCEKPGKAPGITIDVVMKKDESGDG